MRSAIKTLSLFFLSCCMWQPAKAKDFDLVKDGKAVSHIVVPTDIRPAEAYAAVELATYLEKITGARLSIGTEARKDLYNVFLSSSAASLPADIAGKARAIKDDGFLICATEKGLYIVGGQARGVLYGAYEILKKYGDVRWFLPGDEGEYCPKKQTVSVPEQTTVSNPSFRSRQFNLTGGPACTPMTLKWMLRNNLAPDARNSTTSIFYNDIIIGEHDLWTLLPKEFFEKNPELFPLVNGKHAPPSWRASDPGYANPCVSNPETLRLMAENVVKKINRDRLITKYMLVQNDTLLWCECENCRKLDSPKDRQTHGVSNRFWIFANAVIKAIKDNNPSIKICTAAYINAEEPPDQVRPDTRTDIRFCPARRCYLHSIGDESCAVNKAFRERMEKWRKLGMSVETYEYSMFVPVGSKIYSPLEKVHSKDMKYYKKAGVVGYCDERPPLVEKPETFFIKQYLDSGLHNSWKYDFIPRYAQACFLWNADADFDAMMEDLGSKYYGKAWDAAMREYRSLLRDTYEKTPTHFIYGSPNIALGRVLDDKTAARLSSLLEKALASAKGDEKLTARIMLDKEGFDGWLEKHKEYQENRALAAKAVKVEGIPADKDWDSAPAVADFKISRGKDATVQTTAKVLYDEKNIYFRVDALEPKTSMMVSRKTTRDDKIWEDNDLEFFIAPPALGGKYLHLITNASGVVFDAMTIHPTDSDMAFDAGAKVRTKILPDRWRADVSIPFSSLGGAPKEDDDWKVNIARTRKLADGAEDEASSWSEGNFHGFDSYRNLVFQK